MDLTQEEYDKQYQEAMAKMDAEAAGQAPATPSRAPNGQFAKAEETPAEVKQPEAAAPEVAKEAEPANPAEAAPEPEPEKATEPDPLAEMKARLEKAEKQAADNKAWATKLSQRLAEQDRERERQQREAMKPQLLQEHPQLEESIRYVTEAPRPAQPNPIGEWAAVIDRAHPGIFDPSADPELVATLTAKFQANQQEWLADPLTAIREITQEKLAFTQRQVEKRAEAERQKAKQKSAMSIPGPGPSAPKPVDTAAEEVRRIQSMSDAEFEKERRRVLGY